MQENSMEKSDYVLKLNINHWINQFLKSSYVQEFDDQKMQVTPLIISNFVEGMFTYCSLTPKEWNEKAIEEICLYILPTKISGNESIFKIIAPILIKFCSFLSDKGIIPNPINLQTKLFVIHDQIRSRIITKGD